VAAKNLGSRIGRVLRAELQAVRPVDGEWIDVEPLERLEHGLPRTTEERHALLDLRRLRRELQKEDVGERVARAEHGHAQLVAGARELVAELVDLGDGPLEVTLVDLVGGHGGGHGVRGSFSSSAPFP